MRRRALFVSGAGALAAACTARVVPAPTLPPLAANAALGTWPDVIRTAPAPVREAYDWAVRNEQTLRFIPCYCGCGESAGHRDNFDCYVSEVRDRGWVVLDLHSLG